MIVIPAITQSSKEGIFWTQLLTRSLVHTIFFKPIAPMNKFIFSKCLGVQVKPKIWSQSAFGPLCCCLSVAATLSCISFPLLPSCPDHGEILRARSQQVAAHGWSRKAAHGSAYVLLVFGWRRLLSGMKCVEGQECSEKSSLKSTA